MNLAFRLGRIVGRAIKPFMAHMQFWYYSKPHSRWPYPREGAWGTWHAVCGAGTDFALPMSEWREFLDDLLIVAAGDEARSHETSLDYIRSIRDLLQSMSGDKKMGLREVVWVISSTLGYDDTVRVPAACR
jgi:hypothetical protein